MLMTFEEFLVIIFPVDANLNATIVLVMVNLFQWVEFFIKKLFIKNSLFLAYKNFHFSKAYKSIKMKSLAMHHLRDSEKNYSFHSYKLFTN